MFTLPCSALRQSVVHAPATISRHVSLRHAPSFRLRARSAHNETNTADSFVRAPSAGVLSDGSIELMPTPEVVAAVNDALSSVKEHQQQKPPGVVELYGNALATAPVRTKALTSFVGFMLGDLCAQLLTAGSIDIIRCMRLGTYGLLLDGPVGHLWYKVLDAKVSPEHPTKPGAILAKTALDQLLWAPTMTVAFFVFLQLTEGQSDLIISTLQSRVVPTLLANYVIWPFAHYASFRWIPTDYRILYNNVISVAWITWLSMLAAGDISMDLHSLTLQAQHWAAVLSQHHATPTLASFAADVSGLFHYMVSTGVTHMDSSGVQNGTPLEVSYDSLVKLSQQRFINNPPGPWWSQ